MRDGGPFPHHEQGAATSRGTLSSRAREDLRKHLKPSEQMIGATALDISRLHGRDFWSKLGWRARVFCNSEGSDL